MANIIQLNLLKNKSIIAQTQGIPLANENSYKIIAGEENATKFTITSKPTQYASARYTVEMVNSRGYGIDETDIIDDEFILPKGMAIAGYGYISIKAYIEDEIVVFQPLKVKVWNTLPDWKEHISETTAVKVENGHLFVYVNNTWKDLGSVSPDLSNYYNKNEVNDLLLNKISDVKNASGTSYVNNGVATIPNAKANEVGLIRTADDGSQFYGLRVDNSGILIIEQATNAEIDNGTQTHKPITPNNVNYAFKKSLVGTNKITLTEEEKATARETLGVQGGTPTEYLKNASVSGNTLTLTKQDNTTVAFTPQKDYELIEKIIIGYSVLTEQPADFTTNFSNYYKTNGYEPNDENFNYVALTQAETFEVGKYYSFNSSGATIDRAREPDGTLYKFKKMIVKVKAASGQSAGGCYWYIGPGYYANYELKANNLYYVLTFEVTSCGTIATFSNHRWEWRNDPDANYATSFYEGVKDSITSLYTKQTAFLGGTVIEIFGIRA